jgi:hypothetical protein
LAAAWGETLLQAVRQAVSERVLPGTSIKVEAARLGDTAPLVGLAELARSAK